MKFNNFKVKNKTFASYKKVLVIAEIGYNHQNSFNNLKKLINIAKRSGCDAIKLQYFNASKLVSTKSKGYKILKKYELPIEWIKKTSNICRKKNLIFICSPFFKEAIKILKKNKCDVIKIASPEIKNINLLKEIKKSKLPLILSTGDSDIKIVEKAFKILKHNNLSLLHCVSQYPTKTINSNLGMMKHLMKRFQNLPVGFSDHTIDNKASLIAVAGGACIIEKHITLSKKNKGPDNFFSTEPRELKKLVDNIRLIERAFGQFKKKRLPFENTVYICAFTKKKLSRDTILKKKDLFFKRSLKKGLEYEDLKKYLGKKLIKDLDFDTMVDKKNLR